ncbi:MAG: glycosyltransferase [Desulfurococcaceae archaeon]
MIIEILQFIYLLTRGYFYYLPIHLLVFVIFPLVIRHFKAKKYNSNVYENNLYVKCSNSDPPLNRGYKISVIVPVHNEDPNVFEECMRSISANKPDEIVVVQDDNREDIRQIAEKYRAKVISLSERVGKRKALAIGWEIASGEIIIHVDSDTILHENAIDNIIQPFRDKSVVGVQGKVLIKPSKSWLSTLMSDIIELNRDLNNKALNGHLVVVDGRFNAWRRGFLLSVKDEFLNEKFLGRKCEIGDDRFLTYKANLMGYKTCYQEKALAESVAPSSLKKFLRQQLRWGRSGYKAFFKDIYSGLVMKVSLTYNILQFTYYLAPLSFTIALIHDTLFTIPVVKIPVYAVIPIAIIGSSTIALIRRLAVGVRRFTFKEFIVMGFFGLFISYPLMLYALLTIHKQSSWLTR